MRRAPGPAEVLLNLGVLLLALPVVAVLVAGLILSFAGFAALRLLMGGLK